MKRVYLIHANGFTAIEKTAESLSAALEMVHPLVRKAYSHAQVWHNGGWMWCSEGR